MSHAHISPPLSNQSNLLCWYHWYPGCIWPISVQEETWGMSSIPIHFSFIPKYHRYSCEQREVSFYLALQTVSVHPGFCYPSPSVYWEPSGAILFCCLIITYHWLPTPSCISSSAPLKVDHLGLATFPSGVTDLLQLSI